MMNPYILKFLVLLILCTQVLSFTNTSVCIHACTHADLYDQNKICSDCAANTTATESMCKFACGMKRNIDNRKYLQWMCHKCFFVRHVMENICLDCQHSTPGMMPRVCMECKIRGF